MSPVAFKDFQCRLSFDQSLLKKGMAVADKETNNFISSFTLIPIYSFIVIEFFFFVVYRDIG